MRYYPSFNDMFDDLFDTESKNPTKANQQSREKEWTVTNEFRLNMS